MRVQYRQSQIIRNIKNYLVENSKRTLIVVFVFALCVRFLYLLCTGSAYTLDPGDQAAYNTIAMDWISGNGFMEGSSYRPPLYPLVLGILYLIFGTEVIVVKLFQVFLGALACVLVAVIGRQIFNRNIALYAGLCTASTPVLIHYTTQLVTETLFATLLLLFVYILLRKDRKINWLDMVLAGILLGLCTLCRPNTLLLPLTLPLWFFMMGHFNSKKICVYTAFCVIATIVTIAPWTWRNYVVHDSFIPVSTNGGVNLWIGNNPNATGDWINPSDYRLPRGTSEYEIDQDYYNEALQYIRNYPFKTVLRSIKKFVILWSPYPHPFDILPFWAIIITSLLGLAATFKNKRTSILFIIIAYYTLFSCIFFANQRFHVPLLFLLALYAAFGFDWSYNKLALLYNKITRVNSDSKELIQKNRTAPRLKGNIA